MTLLTELFIDLVNVLIACVIFSVAWHILDWIDRVTIHRKKK